MCEKNIKKYFGVGSKEKQTISQILSISIHIDLLRSLFFFIRLKENTITNNLPETTLMGFP